MTEEQCAQIEAHPAFAQLARERRTLGLSLTAAILLIYFGFVIMVAFAPATLATPVSRTVTLGFVLGVLVILAAIALTGIYVFRANTAFDRLTRDILRAAP